MGVGQEGESSALLTNKEFPKSEFKPFGRREGISKTGNLVTVMRTKWKEPANNPVMIQLCNI